MSKFNKTAICHSCGEILEYKMYFAQEHLKKYPNHTGFSIYNLDKN